MKFHIKIIISFLMMAMPLFSFAANEEQQQDPYAAVVAKKIQPIMEKYHIPGMAVELVINGKSHEYYFGVANRETNEPITRKSIFELGSISKVMTSLLIAQEIDWAKMALSDPINKYLTQLPTSFNQMTLQDLATYSSGLPLNLSTNATTKEEVIEKVAHWNSKYNAQEAWIYSNVSMGLLGYALEASTEKSYDKLYYRHIMLPLRMVNGVSISEPLKKYYVQGYNKQDEEAKRVNADVFPSAFGIKASAADMQKFLSAAIGLDGTPERVLYPMRLTQSVFLKVGDEFQGLGWEIHPIIKNKTKYLRKVSDEVNLGPIQISEIYERPTYDGDALIDKTGTTYGFRSYIAVIPNRKAGVVILANKNVPNSVIVKPARELLLDFVS